MYQHGQIESAPLSKMPCLPALSNPWDMVDEQMRKARAETQASFGPTVTFMIYVLNDQCAQELMNNYQAYSTPERIERLQRARRMFGDVRGTLDNNPGVVGNQPPSYCPGVSDSFDTTPHGPNVFNTFDTTPYGPESKDIARLRNNCDVAIRSIWERLSKAAEGQQDSGIYSNGMLSRASPVMYGDNEWMHDMSLDINRMLTMAAFGPFTTRNESATLRKDRLASADKSVPGRNEMPTSSARRNGDVASRLLGNTLQQAAPNDTTPEKSVNNPIQSRAAELPAVDKNHQQGLPAAEQAAVPTQRQTGHSLRLACSSSPMPLPLPTDLNKLPKFKRKKRAEPALQAQISKPCEQKQATSSEALRRQENSPRTSQPRQMPSTIASAPLPAPRVALKPPNTPKTTPAGPQTATNPDRKRSASSSSERSSGAGPQEWYKKQRTGTAGTEALRNGTQQQQQQQQQLQQPKSSSKQLAASGLGLRIPVSLPPKPPVSMPTSQHMSAATQAIHGTGPKKHTSPVKRSHTTPLASVLGSAGYYAAANRPDTQTRAVAISSNNPYVPSTEIFYGSGAQHTTFDLPQRNYVRYRQPAPASSLRGLSQPAPSKAFGSAGPGATRASSGHQLAGQALPYSRAHQVHGRHTSGAVPRSLPAVSDAGQRGFFPTDHRQSPRGP